MPQCGARGYVTVPVLRNVVHPVTLCRFDDKYGLKPKSGPFIPCERRLGIMEISEFKVMVLEAGF